MDIIPRALGDVLVRDTMGRERALGEAWRTRPAVVVWVRHFGCIGCRAHVAELRPHFDAIRRSAELVIVGNGTPAHARRFCELMSLDGVNVLCDEELASYKLAGLRRGWWTLLSPSAIAARLRLGGLHTSIRGDVLQQGGVMVIRPSGEIAFRHVSRAIGDNARAVDVLAALEA